MSKGTYQDFRDALRAFESGWDRDRYDAGNIIDSQLNQWAGGTVNAFFPGYTSWGDLTDAEWDAMSYRSMNQYGFVGYQFGEALLIDLGYYEDDFYYLGGDTLNRWDGTWTGKNGVNSLEDFMTKEKQEVAIQEAFGFNLQIINTQLGYQGLSLDDFLGQVFTYTDVDGSTVEVELTLTGIMAAAHLRGAFGTATLLLGGGASTDENGTSILRYIQDYGGYDAPTVDEAIAFFEDRKTGDEGLDTPPGDGTPPSPEDPPGGNGEADVTRDSADVVITWSWGQDAVISDFDPSEDTIFVDWIGADALEITETADGVVFAVPSNNQTTTLLGVTLAALSPANFTILDDTAAAEILALIGAGDPPDDEPPVEDPPIDPPLPPMIMIGPDAQADATTDPVRVLPGFDPASQMIHIEAGVDAAGFAISEIVDATYGASVAIEISVDPALPAKTFLFAGLSLDDLDLSDFMIADAGVGDEVAMALGEDHGGMTGTMYMIDIDTPAQVIDGFDPMIDMIHLQQTVTSETFVIFEESGDALGTTVRIGLTQSDGSVNQIVFTGLALADLTLANFSVANQGVLNEVTAAIGATIADPGPDGLYTLTYDNDGSNPPATTGATDAGGVKYRADSNADDIVGFDPAVDEIDFGGTSVHGMIITKSQAGEIVIDSPWSEAAQIVQGVTYQDVTIETFGVVGNEHFRQDIGGVVSWELGVGPREADTVYVRSHEYGVAEVVDGFDPTTDKLSFLYFGTRERLEVQDSDAGLVISSLPAGQSLTLTGVTLADLRPGLVEFHFDQVMEDNLEVSFGFDQDLVTLVDRTMLLTPEAPAGVTTDGFQTRIGDIDGDGVADGEGGGTPPDAEPPIGTPPGDGIVVDFGAGQQVLALDWSYGQTKTVTGFDLDEDLIDFGTFNADQLAVTEADGDLIIEVLGNGGDFDVLAGVQAEDLSAANLTAPGWNAILDPQSALIQALVDLGFELA